MRRGHFHAGNGLHAEGVRGADVCSMLKHNGMLAGGAALLANSELYARRRRVWSSSCEAYDDALAFVAGRRDAERRASKLGPLFPCGCDPKCGASESASSIPTRPEGSNVRGCGEAGRCSGRRHGSGQAIQVICRRRKYWNGMLAFESAGVICPTSLNYQWPERDLRGF